MARRKKPPSPNLDQPGQPSLLQGHLRAGGTRDPELPGAGAEAGTDAGGESRTSDAGKPASGQPASAQPATEGTQGTGDAVKGKATRSPAEVATRPHLEGPEEGPK
jgi:hypothetical protein